jgi:hypothetical protein
VLSLEDDLAGPDIPGEEFLANVGRLRNARMRAEAMTLAELVYSQPRSPARSTWRRQGSEYPA